MTDLRRTALVTPIDVAWVSRGGTGARNYDEFNDDADIEAVIRAQPDSILAVDMPHCAPEDRAAGHGFADALPAAGGRLERLKAAGRFARADDVVLPYRIDSPDGAGEPASYGLWAMVRTAEISASPEVPGRVVRNEDVFPAKVAERLALTETVQHLLSAVLLLAPDAGDRLTAALTAWCTDREPAATDVDDAGRRHSVWLMPAGPERNALLALLDGELIVADGNHRSLAAQEGGLERFLAVVTAPGALTIQPYNRLLRSLPLLAATLPERLTAAGFDVRPLDRPADVPRHAGRVELYVEGASYDVGLPASEAGSGVADRLDHAVVERELFGRVLGWAPDDKRIGYVGGDYPAAWLRGEVDAGRAAAAVLIAPVSTDDFVRVNHERMKMPRKSTWFTPKARAGLVLAEL